LFSYTHSKIIDNVGEIGAWVGPQTGFQNNNCFSCDRSVSFQNIPDVIRMSFQYELPFGPGRPILNQGVIANVIGGWKIGGFLTFDNGLPVFVTSPNDTNSFGGASFSTGFIRPNSTGQSATLPDGPQIKDNGQYFNPAAFSRTPPFTFGNVSRNLPDVRLPGTYNWDMLLSKNFKFRERISLEFRGEYFNAFNHVQFAGPERRSRVSCSCLQPTARPN
jgi:hypothetical protein